MERETDASSIASRVTNRKRKKTGGSKAVKKPKITKKSTKAKGKKGAKKKATPQKTAPKRKKAPQTSTPKKKKQQATEIKGEQYMCNASINR